MRPAFPLRQRIARLAWNSAERSSTACRLAHCTDGAAMLLRLFGAKMGLHCHFYLSSRVWPWNLICADLVTAGDGAEIYNPAPLRLASHERFSQNSYLCGAIHDFDDAGFPLLAYATEVGPMPGSVREPALRRRERRRRCGGWDWLPWRLATWNRGASTPIRLQWR